MQDSLYAEYSAQLKLLSKSRFFGYLENWLRSCLTDRKSFGIKRKKRSCRRSELKCKIQFRQKFKFCTFFSFFPWRILQGSRCFLGSVENVEMELKRALVRIRALQGGLKKSVPLLRYYISWPVSVNLVPCMGLKNGIEHKKGSWLTWRWGKGPPSFFGIQDETQRIGFFQFFRYIPVGPN